MGKRRPINRRPWRKAPWRKVQWRDFSFGAFDRDDAGETYDECAVPMGDIECEAFDGSGTTTVRFIWAGPADAEHVDDNSVLIERIVGSISVRGVITGETAGPFALPDRMPLVRLGLLALQEIAPDGETEPEKINLWSDAHLEDFQWMWLHQVEFENPVHWTIDGYPYQSWHGAVRIPVDVGVRRKLSRRDGVALLASFVVPTRGGGPVGLPAAVQMYPILRVLQSVK